MPKVKNRFFFCPESLPTRSSPSSSSFSQHLGQLHEARHFCFKHLKIIYQQSCNLYPFRHSPSFFFLSFFHPFSAPSLYHLCNIIYLTQSQGYKSRITSSSHCNFTADHLRSQLSSFSGFLQIHSPRDRYTTCSSIPQRPSSHTGDWIDIIVTVAVAKSPPRLIQEHRHTRRMDDYGP